MSQRLPVTVTSKSQTQLECVHSSVCPSIIFVVWPSGDVFLAAACVSYVGPLTGSYREKLIQGWKQRCQELAVPVSDPFTLQATLATPMAVQEWNLQV